LLKGEGLTGNNVIYEAIIMWFYFFCVLLHQWN